MTTLNAMQKLGQYIVRFQGLEQQLNEFIILLADLDDSEIVKILVHDLEFGKRVATADVLFSHIVKTRFPSQSDHILQFHKAADDLINLSKTRNNFVHSTYLIWLDVEGRGGLIRSNSTLKPSRGTRVNDEVEMLPEAFDGDLEKLGHMAVRLEKYRLLLIDWLYPDA